MGDTNTQPVFIMAEVVIIYMSDLKMMKDVSQVINVQIKSLITVSMLPW